MKQMKVPGCLRGCLAVLLVLVLTPLLVLVASKIGIDFTTESSAFGAGKKDGRRWALSGYAYPDRDLLSDHADFREQRWKSSHTQSENSWTTDYIKGFQEGFDRQ